MTDRPLPSRLPPIAKHLRGGLSALCLALASAAHAQPDDALGRARELLAARQPAAAFALLDPLEPRRAGQPAFDYLLGIAALDSGRTTRAIFALERVLETEPSNALARAELARAYLAAGESEAARQELERARAAGIPEAARAGIDRMLSTIGQLHASQRTQWRGYAELGLGYDTNVNSATGDSQVAIPALGGLTFTLDPASRRLHDAFALLGGGASVRVPLAPDLAFAANIAASRNFHRDQDRFEAGVLDVNAGLTKTVGASVFSAVAQAGGYWIGGSRFRDAWGALGQWQYNLGVRDQTTVFVQATRLEYPGNTIRDANRWLAGAGYAHAYGNGAVAFASLYGGREEARAAGVPQLDHAFAGVRLGGQHDVGAKLTLFANLSGEARRYGGTEPLFSEARRDRQTGLSAGLHYAIAPEWRLTPQIAVTDNRSNIPIYAFRRVVSTLTLRRAF